MKTLIKTMALITGLAFAFTGCKKESASNNNNSNDAAVFAQGLQTIITANQPAVHTVTINANIGGTIIGDNTRLQFWPSAFVDAQGNFVTGNVQVEMQEFYKKGQMVLANKTTTSSQGLLDSRGEVYLNFTQNGNALHIRQGYGAIYFNSHNNNQPMNLYTGQTSGALADISWTQTTISPTTSYFTCSYDSSSTPVHVDTSNASLCDTLYSFPIDSGVHWVNCDYFYSYPSITSLTMNVPGGYDNTNTVVYVVFSSINCALRVNEYLSLAFIAENGFRVPVGMQATIVALNYHGGSWYSCFKPITITNNDVETLTFTSTTIADYTAQVNAL